MKKVIVALILILVNLMPNTTLAAPNIVSDNTTTSGNVTGNVTLPIQPVTGNITANITSVNITPNLIRDNYVESNFVMTDNGSIFGVINASNSSGLGMDYLKSELLYTISNDLGYTWSDNQVLITHGVDWGVSGASMIYSRGVIWLLWSRYYSDTKNTVYLRHSSNNGANWTDDIQIQTPYTYNGVCQNGIVTSNGTLIFPAAYTTLRILSLENIIHINNVAFIVSSDNGSTWNEYIVPRNIEVDNVDEPTIVELSDGTLLAYLRTDKKVLFQTYSKDNGKTWVTPYPTTIMSPDSNAALARQSPDIIRLVWNYDTINRYPLKTAISRDNGASWVSVDVINSDNHSNTYPKILNIPQDDTWLFVWWSNPKPHKDSIKAIKWKIKYTSDNLSPYEAPKPPAPPPVFAGGGGGGGNIGGGSGGGSIGWKPPTDNVTPITDNVTPISDNTTVVENVVLETPIVYQPVIQFIPEKPIVIEKPVIIEPPKTETYIPLVRYLEYIAEPKFCHMWRWDGDTYY